MWKVGDVDPAIKKKSSCFFRVCSVRRGCDTLSSYNWIQDGDMKLSHLLPKENRKRKEALMFWWTGPKLCWWTGPKLTQYRCFIFNQFSNYKNVDVLSLVSERMKAFPFLFSYFFVTMIVVFGQVLANKKLL